MNNKKIISDKIFKKKLKERNEKKSPKLRNVFQFS
jgi:hypothetical protein